MEHKESKPKMKIKKSVLWKGISAVLLVLLAISIYTNGFSMAADNGEDQETEIGSDETVSLEGASALIINDERCDTCDTTMLEGQLTQTLPGLNLEKLDYSSSQAKEIYSDSGLSALPAVLFTSDIKDHENYAQIEQYIEEKGDYLSLRVGSSFDPEAEICDNDIDDNGDGNVDCADDDCKGAWKCMEKKETPEVDLFVMSHCPYGTQIEKGMIPVIETLGDNADIKIKFCDYAMHGEEELEEQMRQYCIQEEQESKFIDYLTCFLDAGESGSCLAETGIDTDKLSSCVDSVDSKHSIMENFADKSTWRSARFPLFPVFQEEVDKYGVRGSPTLVINGVTASAGRDPASLLDAVCTGFEDAPEECDSELSSTAPAPGFGFEGAAASGSTATCG